MPLNHTGTCAISGTALLIQIYMSKSSALVDSSGRSSHHVTPVTSKWFGRIVSSPNRPFQALKTAICPEVSRNKLVANLA
ncbi:hypothetical protein Y032_0029g2013 [Ancylostoma ceylanicum]|uniref:Uncharacterized protein n=1 Tax=Ancylostoma ceylanicum TaxID=53326 RepID=A0A016URI6_9BILA|nr:hypothetical protein Y032_0029g2013 [Ancylostoma ceylanicum]